VMDRTLHALIGPNGAGKTTAFNLLSGLFPPDAGTIELEGHSIAGLKPEDITAAGVGRSFQITNLFGGLSAEENLRLAVQARSAKRFALWTSAAAVADGTPAAPGRGGGEGQRGARGLYPLARPWRHRTGGSSLALLGRPAPARQGARHRDAAANSAAGRAARRARRRRAHAHRRAADDHLRGNS